MMWRVRVPGAAQHRLVVRCRPGTVANSVSGTVPDQRCTASRCTASGTRSVALLVAVILIVVISASGLFAQTFTPRDENPEDFPAGAGRDDTFYACTACHGFKLVAQQGMTRGQWEDSLAWMTQRHGMPPLPEKEQKIVLDYLEATFPPRAPAGRGGWQNPFAPR